MRVGSFKALPSMKIEDCYPIVKAFKPLDFDVVVGAEIVIDGFRFKLSIFALLAAQCWMGKDHEKVCYVFAGEFYFTLVSTGEKLLILGARGQHKAFEWDDPDTEEMIHMLHM